MTDFRIAHLPRLFRETKMLASSLRVGCLLRSKIYPFNTLVPQIPLKKAESAVAA